MERGRGVWSAYIGSEKDISWVYTLVVNTLWNGFNHPARVKGGFSSLKTALAGVCKE